MMYIYARGGGCVKSYFWYYLDDSGSRMAVVMVGLAQLALTIQ